MKFRNDSEEGSRITYRDAIVDRAPADPITPATTLEMVGWGAIWNGSWSGGGEASEAGEDEGNELHLMKAGGSVRCDFGGDLS